MLVVVDVGLIVVLLVVVAMVMIVVGAADKGKVGAGMVRGI
jgi:hypothetical protein